MQRKYRWHTTMGVAHLDAIRWAYREGWLLLAIHDRQWHSVVEFLSPVPPTIPPYEGVVTDASDLPLLR